MTILDQYQTTKRRISDHAVIREIKIPESVLERMKFVAGYGHFDMRAWVSLVQQDPGMLPETLKTHLADQEFDLNKVIIIHQDLSDLTFIVAQMVTYHDVADRMLGRN